MFLELSSPNKFSHRLSYSLYIRIVLILIILFFLHDVAIEKELNEQRISAKVLGYNETRID